jgi:hypothetical protein
MSDEQIRTDEETEVEHVEEPEVEGHMFTAVPKTDVPKTDVPKTDVPKTD